MNGPSIELHKYKYTGQTPVRNTPFIQIFIQRRQWATGLLAESRRKKTTTVVADLVQWQPEF
jgi:hypothetical protein